MAEDLPREGGVTGSESGDQLAEALAAAEADPENDACWDRLEDLAEQTQRPDEVGALYRSVLAQDLSRDLAESLGQRAAGFHEQWFAEDSPHLVQVLSRVLEIDPEADWAQIGRAHV